MNDAVSTVSLDSIRYPIFKLGLNKPEQQDGIIFYFHVKEDPDDGYDTSISLRIIDDKNVIGDSLSTRRLKLLKDRIPLFKVHNAIYFLGDLIKLATPKTWFIDSNGKVFNYLKTSMAKLQVHKVTKILPIKSGGAVVEVQGLLSRFKCLYLPEQDVDYAGILHIGFSKVFYGFYDKQYDNSWRKV